MRHKSVRACFIAAYVVILWTFHQTAFAQRETRRFVVAGDVADAPLMRLAQDDSDHTQWEGAEQLANSLERLIKDQPASLQPFRIAIFPFGRKKNNEDRLTPTQAAKTLALQATLTSTIRKRLIERNLERPFMLLDKFSLERAFQDSAIDPLAISPNNDELSQVLRELKIDVAIVGTFHDGAGEGFAGDDKSPEIEAHLISSGMQPPTPPIVGTPDLTDFHGTTSDLTSPRFGVSLWARKPGGEWTRIKLVVDKNAGLQCQIYALVPDELQNAEYKIRVACNGIRSIRNVPLIEDFPGNIVNENPIEDANRLFGAAVLVDGVNSIYEKLGQGAGPLVVHPRDARKWLLCRPGFVIEAGDGGTPYIKHVAGPDHSTVEIMGWQSSDDKARAFRFANVGRGEGIVAESLGVTDDMGLISVYLFGEKLQGDRMLPGMAARPGPMNAAPKPTLGTAAGREIASRTQAVQVELYKTPMHQIHILYRAEQDCPIRPADRLELGEASPPRRWRR